MGEWIRSSRFGSDFPKFWCSYPQTRRVSFGRESDLKLRGTFVNDKPHKNIDRSDVKRMMLMNIKGTKDVRCLDILMNLLKYCSTLTSTMVL